MNAPTTGSLRGLRVLVTRPQHQANTLCRALSDAGGDPIPLPLLSIEGPDDPDAVTQQLTRAFDDDLWVFTSANAVVWAARLCPPAVTPWPSQLAAAGRGTATALALIGRDDAFWPRGKSGADGLLAMSRLAAPAAWRVSIVCGERSRATLRDGLANRGAQVRAVTVYRRVLLTPSAASVAHAVSSAQAAIVTSGETLQQLAAITPAAMRDALLGLQLVLPSPRVVEMARQLGFRSHLLTPDRVDDESFVNALVRWRSRGP